MEKKSSNVVWHHATVTRDRREALNGHRSVMLWFTGLSGAGKSTLAHAVEEYLYQKGCRTFTSMATMCGTGFVRPGVFCGGSRREYPPRGRDGQAVLGGGGHCAHRLYLSFSLGPAEGALPGPARRVF